MSVNIVTCIIQLFLLPKERQEALGQPHILGVSFSFNQGQGAAMWDFPVFKKK